MEKEKQQELMFKLSLFEQQAGQLNEQLEAVEKGINDLGILNFGLDDIKGSKGKEIVAPLGRGIFVKTKLNSEDLIVDIGGKNLVKKSIPETKEIIEDQIKKLISIKKELEEHLDKIQEELAKTISEFQKEKD